MNRHYDRYLTEKYAPLYKDRYGDMLSTCMVWGFAVGDGWFNLINALSRELCWKWLEAKSKYDAMKDNEGKLLFQAIYGDDSEMKESEMNYRITAAKIAEAKAKMDEEAEKVPAAVQVKEKFGGLRFYVNGATDEQYAKIHFAESLSLTTCEVCGKMGKRGGRGWITTRCKEHRRKDSDD